jgi:hypothetical protein
VRVFLTLLVVALVAPAQLLAQSVTLGGSLSVAAAEDFATRSLQDPWDMNERTDLGWFLNGIDGPASNLTNVSFAGGVFSATVPGSIANVFLLESAIINSAPIGKIGTNYPINAGFYRVLAIRMNVSAAASAQLVWFRESMYDGTFSVSGTFAVTPGWRTYLVNIPALTVAPGSGTAWTNVLLKSLQLYILPQAGPITWQVDSIRLVNEHSNYCRQITWSGFGGPVDLYLDSDSATNGNEWLLATGVVSNTASGGCAPTGSGYNFAAGALEGASYYVVARPAGSGSGGARSSQPYQVNAAPIVTITAPSEEGSSDDFATTVLGDPWDMNALSDVDLFFNVAGQTITTIAAETPAGTPLGNVQVLWAQNAQPTSNDPVVGLLWGGALIDPLRYRILTVEFGLPNIARSIAQGSVARIGWRVAGSTESGSDDIIINSRAGSNVMQKLIVDMADRGVLPLEAGSPLGWVPGNSATPGIDLFRFDVHEFPQAVPFFVRRVTLAALERVWPGADYTIRWTPSETSGTVTAYYDTDNNPSNGVVGVIGSAPTNTRSLVWRTPTVGGSPAYYIRLVIDDGQGNTNEVYSRWPVIVGAGPGAVLTTPGNLRVIP